MSITDAKKKYLEEIQAIVPVKPITSMDQVRDPKVLEWCIGELEQGRSFHELQALTGLLGEKKRYLWRRLRASIMAFQTPKDELTALTAYYLEQEEEVEKLRADIEDLDRRIEAGPNDRVAKNAKGEEFVVEDKTFNSLLDYRIKARKILIDETKARLSAFHENKKVKDGHGKYAGAVIHIHSNVPRPSLQEAEEALEGDDE